MYVENHEKTLFRKKMRPSGRKRTLQSFHIKEMHANLNITITSKPICT